MPFVTLIQIVWTIVVMIIFLAIVLWAWSGRRKESFNDAANIPLEEEEFLEEEVTSAEINEENLNA
ncbi:MAG: cbb3-type cytochrome c oxidase subunit 3 [Gammaproteobacteria bacterium]